MSEDVRSNLKSGMIVRIHQKIKETNAKGEEKERIQMFEGTILAVKHGNEPGATVTVRKVSNGVGVEKIFPINSPIVEKIELVREMAVKQSKAFYLRTYKKKLKEIKKKLVGKKEEIVKEEVDNPVLEVEEVKEVEPVVESPSAEATEDKEASEAKSPEAKSEGGEKKEEKVEEKK
ncbi:MAG: 50S ribosomal protein L19 [Candidatus Magasanikbacteria bacterium]|jgi:large subunit ribosomal protein L19|nr:50S ribosomal protein L19 [Candidatus Magasanikbacteria bacterium]MBT4314851.1 50S ribosomal protein L19 [Candidatus Magasanikbacteria bacterium]MBT4546762.1 50S ribosomal protein L19 [Candidatus Magasanikbacteria bacterium]MBT6819629.1 50S ribosomal protein L19 [Candidatus Magasanikbacteria bacterium]